MPVRHRGDQALASRGAAILAGHVGLRPGFIEEDQAPRRQTGLALSPCRACRGDVRALLLGGVE